jgi:hypothetical protein
MNAPIFVTTVVAALQMSAFGTLSISEFLAINGSGDVDKDGDRSDWIEIHNSGDTAVALKGWYLTDDADRLTKWTIPMGSVPARGYSVIHASGKDFSGLFSSEVHANFSLTGDGEYLALVEPDGITIAHEFAPLYPAQRRDVSYGISEDGDVAGYFPSPTQGEANGASSEGLVSSVKFSVKRGYQDAPIALELTSETPGALIRYTTNGSEPSLFTGKTYDSAIAISRTTTVRARAEKSGFINSKLKTHTYLFVNDVIQQDTMSTNVTEDPVYGPLMREALLKYPAISLVTPDTDISKTAEDPTSVEMIFPDGSDGFQIDAGVKRVGGHSLNAYPKNNMRLYFRSEYGSEKLRFPLYEDHLYTDVAADSFDQLNLRGGSHDSLFYLGATNNPQPPSNGQYLRNRWISDMQFLMGHESLRGRWTHVYINGTYWGHYQLLERNTQDYFATYLGGQKSDYVAINKGQGIGSSDMRAWTAMRNSRTDYEEFKRRVDIINYVDYMLLSYYCGNDWDWNPEQNWAGGGPVEPDSGGMKFLAWDSDIIFRRLNDNNLGKGGPHSMFPILMQHEDFAMLVADRIQKHFHNDGLLTPENVARVYNVRAEEIRLSIIPETARWQAGRWTRDDQWQDELDRLNNDFFPSRTKEILSQFRAKGWSAAITAPRMSPLGGYVEGGFTVRILKSLFARGIIVYTTDGTDPRLPGGELSPAAVEFKTGFSLTEATTVKARVMNSDGWSALTEARFVVNQVPATVENLTISKVHYRPAAASAEEVAAGFQSRKDFEFVELLNLGSETIDLHDVRFNKGIRFEFSGANIKSIAGGERLFLVRNRQASAMRYGTGLPIAGSFSGSLSNDGEPLQIVNRTDEVLQLLAYNDVEPWPLEADGGGAYLVLIDAVKAEPDNALQWRASAAGELPGDNEPGTPIDMLTYAAWIARALSVGDDDEPTADVDHDGFANLLEFALGTDPTVRESVPKFSLSSTDSETLQYETFPRPNTTGVRLSLQVSSDLEAWEEVAEDTILTLTESESGAVIYRFPRKAMDDGAFFRLQAE